MVVHPLLESKFFAAARPHRRPGLRPHAAARDPGDRRRVHVSLHRAVPRPAAVRASPTRSSRSARGRRRSCTRRSCPSGSGAEVWLKIEGANPTGSFKDRGMTCAVSAAVREGAEAVICASTGNTAASAAAYAAKAGLTGAVIVPEGKIATGKLAQALMHGARVIALRGELRPGAPARARARRAAPDRARQQRQRRSGWRGRRRRRSSCSTTLGSLDLLCIPVGNAGNVTAYWKGFREARRRAAAVRLPGRGRGAARARAAGRAAGDGRQRDPDRQPGAVGGGDGGDDASRAARSARSPTTRSSPPTGCSPRARACSASRPARRRSPGC